MAAVVAVVRAFARKARATSHALKRCPPASRGLRARRPRASRAKAWTKSCGLRAGFARALRATPAGFAHEGADEVVREVVHEFVAVFVLM